MSEYIEQQVMYRFASMAELMKCLNTRHAHPETDDPNLLELRSLTPDVLFNLPDLIVTGPEFQIEVLLSFNGVHDENTIFQ